MPPYEGAKNMSSSDASARSICGSHLARTDVTAVIGQAVTEVEIGKATSSSAPPVLWGDYASKPSDGEVSSPFMWLYD